MWHQPWAVGCEQLLSQAATATGCPAPATAGAAAEAAPAAAAAAAAAALAAALLATRSSSPPAGAWGACSVDAARNFRGAAPPANAANLRTPAPLPPPASAADLSRAPPLLLLPPPLPPLLPALAAGDGLPAAKRVASSASAAFRRALLDEAGRWPPAPPPCWESEEDGDGDRAGDGASLARLPASGAARGPCACAAPAACAAAAGGDCAADGIMLPAHRAPLLNALLPSQASGPTSAAPTLVQQPLSCADAERALAAATWRPSCHATGSYKSLKACLLWRSRPQTMWGRGT